MFSFYLSEKCNNAFQQEQTLNGSDGYDSCLTIFKAPVISEPALNFLMQGFQTGLFLREPGVFKVRKLWEWWALANTKETPIRGYGHTRASEARQLWAQEIVCATVQRNNGGMWIGLDVPCLEGGVLGIMPGFLLSVDSTRVPFLGLPRAERALTFISANSESIFAFLDQGLVFHFQSFAAS